MNWIPLVLFALGFCILICKRTVVDLICGTQICFMGLLGYVAFNGAASLGLGFILLLAAGLFGAVGMSVLFKSGFLNGDGNE